MDATATNTNKIKQHYDLVSPYYHSLWSEHIHHGYWLSGKESKEKATIQLMELLASKVKIRKRSKILDVGCGVGGGSRWLQRKFDAKVTAITISKKQIEIAKSLTASKNVEFVYMDANKITLHQKYNLIWSVEMISHLNKREDFFKKCHALLEKNGYIVLTDWFAAASPDKSQRKTIDNINKRMLVSMQTPQEYCEYLRAAGFEILHAHDISKKVSKTWDICIQIIRKKEFWKLAITHGTAFVDFLRAFQDMRRGFHNGGLQYYFIIAKKITQALNNSGPLHYA